MFPIKVLMKAFSSQEIYETVKLHSVTIIQVRCIVMLFGGQVSMWAGVQSVAIRAVTMTFKTCANRA